MIWLLPHPLSCQQVVCLSQSSCVSLVELTDRREVGVGGGAKPCDGEKAWPSINHSILSGCTYGRTGIEHRKTGRGPRFFAVVEIGSLSIIDLAVVS
jgi:hypothetical protein